MAPDYIPVMIYSEKLHSRADLHVHSKYSDRPSEWFLRRIDSPESFVDPQALYRTCRERGTHEHIGKHGGQIGNAGELEIGREFRRHSSGPCRWAILKEIREKRF